MTEVTVNTKVTMKELSGAFKKTPVAGYELCQGFWEVSKNLKSAIQIQI